MWCRNVLRTCTIFHKPTSIFSCLQCLTSTNFDGVTLKHPARRLLVSDARECTIGKVIDQWSHRFESEGVPEPTESIERIMAYVTETKKITDILNDPLNASQMEKVESLCKCRLSRMPIEYLTGEWHFQDITLKLVPPIFVPWPETEDFVKFLVKRLSSLNTDNCEIVEIGCGSGVITLAVARNYKKIKFTAIDANPNACDLTMINRNKLNLTNQVAIINATLKPDASVEVSSDWNGAVDVDLNSKLFDFVISNPPYVPTKKQQDLTPEIRNYQDNRAFDGGDDGMKMIKPVLKYAAKSLKPGGRLFMEVDPITPDHIRSFINKYPDLKLHYENTYKDFANYDRIVEIVKAT